MDDLASGSQPDLGAIGDILDHMSDAFYTVDRDWRFTYINRKAENLWGRSRAELLGRVIWDVFPAAVGTPTYHHQIRAAAENRAVTYETTSPVIGRWIRVSAFPNTAGLAVYFHDIHERKEEEAERARLYEAERQARLATEQAAERALRLSRVVSTLSQALTLEQIGQGFAEQVAAALGAVAATISVLDAAGTQLELVGHAGYAPGAVARWQHFPLDVVTPVTDAIRQRDLVLLPSPEAWQSRYPHLERSVSSHAAWAAAPLVVEGRALGALGLAFAEPHNFSPEDQALLLTLAGHGAQALARVLAYADLEARVRDRTAALEKSLAERTLAEARFRDLLEAAPDAIVIADEAARIVLVNSQAEILLGCTRSELLGQPVQSLIPERFVAQHARRWQPYLAEPRQRNMGQDVPLTARRGDGSEIPVEISISPLQTSAGLLVLAALRDVTERYEAQEQLRRLSAYLQESVEAERKRIAQQVHDELGQALTSLKLGLAQLDRDPERTPADRSARIHSLLAEIDATIVNVRRIATELRPAVLDDLGLSAAVEWQCAEFESRTGLACSHNVELDDSLVAPAAATAVFRILQETLTNVIRHAQATHVAVSLRCQDGQVLLEVRDNGRGITPGEIGNRHSLGLLGMRERVQSVQGRMDISGAPGEGTLVQISVPLGAA